MHNGILRFFWTEFCSTIRTPVVPNLPVVCWTWLTSPYWNPYICLTAPLFFFHSWTASSKCKRKKNGPVFRSSAGSNAVAKIILTPYLAIVFEHSLQPPSLFLAPCYCFFLNGWLLPGETIFVLTSLFGSKCLHYDFSMTHSPLEISLSLTINYILFFFRRH